MRKLLFLACFLLPHRAGAEDVIVPEAFAFYPTVAVSFQDNVKDGCVSQPEKVKQAFELELDTSGVDDDVKSVSQITVSFSGGLTYNRDGTLVGCVGEYILEYKTVALLQEGGFIKSKEYNLQWLTIYRDSGVIASNKEEFQSHAEHAALQLAHTFAVDWLKARQQ